MRGPTLQPILSGMLLVAFGTLAHAAVETEALVGAPFGIGRITIPLSPDDNIALHTNAFTLTETDGRVLYPTFTNGTVRRLLEGILGGGRNENAISAVFLFTGAEPLKVTLTTTQKMSFDIVPRRGTRLAFNLMLQTWWREYNDAARKQVEAGDYPPLIETYLTTMLGTRLGLDPPLLSRLNTSQPGEIQQTLELLFGVEKLRLDTMRATMLGYFSASEPADRPLPADILWTPPAALAEKPSAKVEAIASRVPEECFYVRFGTFDNYIWLSHLMDEFAADASRVISVRGHDSRAGERLHRQLALKQSKVGEIFGGQVIEDVAMIGRDFYLREGAAFGILFQAKNNAILGGDLSSQRAAILKENEAHGAELAVIKVGDHKMSLLSTPDNRLRSYYAVDGNFHLVTTSRAIAERFLTTGERRKSLGDSLEFRNARQLMPLTREDTIFVYLPSAFMRGLISPQYQIELQRRLRSVTDMELVQLARLAAQAEGQPHDTIDELIAGHFLPPGFGLRPDGSGPIMTDNGAIDSKRGGRGMFVPIPDVEIAGVTRAEEAGYVARALYYQANWRQMDPLMIGVKRYALDKNGKERLVVDANVAPLGEQKYGWLLSLLGPATNEKVASAPGDIISAQMSIKGGLLLPSIPPHHLFGAVQDVAPPQTDLQPTGFFKALKILHTTPGYIGAWPKPGFLDLLPFGLAGRPDALGYSKLLFSVWRRQFGGFSVLSFDRAMLEHVTPHLRMEEVETPAQIRLAVGDISRSKLNDWFTALNYQRAKQTTLGNVRLLNTLTQQLHVPVDQSLKTAEDLLDVKLTCSLGGDYETARNAHDVTTWRTSSLPNLSVAAIPADYVSPLLTWFRTLNVELTKVDGRMTIHAHFDMQRKEGDSSFTLPTLDLFGTTKNAADKKVENKPPLEEIKPPAKKSDGPKEF